MANVVQGGQYLNDALQHGLLNVQTNRAIQQMNNSFRNTLDSSVTGWFKETVETSHERWGGSKVRGHMEALVRKSKAYWQSDTYTYITSLDQLQTARRKNREVIMCHEGLSRRYEDQMCHGYNGDFKQHRGHGRENHFWRMVHQGCEETNPNGFTGWSTFADEWEENEELSKWENAYALITHSSIDNFLKGNIDCTDELSTGWN